MIGPQLPVIGPQLPVIGPQLPPGRMGYIPVKKTQMRWSPPARMQMGQMHLRASRHAGAQLAHARPAYLH